LRERKKQKTRWAIQEHALRLIAQQGYDATTVEQIAAAAEISPSTFFRYFKTKEDVVTEDEYDPMLVELIGGEPAERTPLQALRSVIGKAFAQMDAVERERILERTRLMIAVPALRAKLYDNLVNSIDMLTGVIAGRLGRDPGDFAIRAFAGAVIGAEIAAMLEWAGKGGAGDLGKLMDDALAVLEPGLS
jgi:AcrR family transcriptional regulator